MPQLGVTNDSDIYCDYYSDRVANEIKSVMKYLSNGFKLIEPNMLRLICSLHKSQKWQI